MQSNIKTDSGAPSSARRPGSRRVFAASVVLLVFAVLLLVFSIVQNRRPAAGSQNGFLVQGGEAPFYAAAGNGLAVATTDSIQLFSSNGKCAASAEVTMRSPLCSGSALLSIYYDLESGHVYALYPDGMQRETELDGVPLFADVNETGLVSVLWEKADGRDCVMVYDTDLTPLFRWDAGTAYPLSARVSANDVLCVSCVTGEGSSLRFFRIDREDALGSFSVSGELIVDFGFLSDGTVAAVTPERLLLLTETGELVAEHSFDGSHLGAFCLRGDFAAVATATGLSGGSEVLTTISGTGQILGSCSAQRATRALSVSGDRLLALFTGEEATLYTRSMEEIISYQPEPDVTQIFLCGDGMAFFTGASGVTQIDFSR